MVVWRKIPAEPALMGSSCFQLNAQGREESQRSQRDGERWGGGNERRAEAERMGLEGCGSTDCTFHLAPALTTAAEHHPGIAQMETHAVCGVGEGGRTKPDVRWEGGRRRFVRNTKYCLFFKIKNSRKCDEGS